MSKIRFKKCLISASTIPAGARSELIGKTVKVHQPVKIVVGAQPTVGIEEALEGLERLNRMSYVVTPVDLWCCVLKHNLPHTRNWMEENPDTPFFFFSREHCEFLI